MGPEIRADRDGAASLRLDIGLYVPTIKKSKKERYRASSPFGRATVETANRTDPNKDKKKRGTL